MERRGLRILIGIIFMCIIALLALIRNNSKDEKVYLQDKENHIKLYDDKIALYNSRDEIIDKYLLKEKIFKYFLGNISEDDRDMLVILTGDRDSRYGKDIVIFSLENRIEEIYREDFSDFNPWKIAIGDIDGDGVGEISIGVYKESPLHKIMAKRPFIYTFKDGVLQPKWRGSRLSRPFDDYDFIDIDDDGIDEIISIEILEDKKKVINSYKWKGFGFEGYLESKAFKDMRDLTVKGDKIYLKVKEGNRFQLSLLKLGKNSLEIERVN